MNVLGMLRSSALLLSKVEKMSTTCCFCAGHSHWQNIRHLKAAKDKEKSNKNQHYSNLIRRAMREKQPDSKIKEILLCARAASVPQSTLDRALRDTEMVDPYVVASRAAGGIIVLVESVCPKMVREKQTMAAVFKKYGFKAAADGSVVARDFFDHMGFIVCEPNAKMSSLDDAMEIGLEVGAEEVDCVSLSDSETLFQFQCRPREISQLENSLKDIGASIVESQDRYLPKDLVPITTDTYKMMEEMYGRLRENCDAVDRIFDNVEVS